MTTRLLLPLAMGLLRPHIRFSTTIILHAASFTAFCGIWLFLVGCFLWNVGGS
ncbi:hypothetical protein HNQ69_001452 [Bartonella callosciuri]|uniref:Uncharacterized protein n=1 Tax=Bartonella callosciuri TaxID=686223 RepID=A0A840NS12_9HYPH|nr:hypothetical protein [Bartonella callosciuri]MBB5074314.1 hypothetical protein [Bartonella callosciuri]